MNIAELTDEGMVNICNQYNLPVRYLDSFGKVLDRIFVSNQIAAYFRKSSAPVPIFAKFSTVALQTNYTVDDAPDLQNIVNKEIYTVTVDGSPITSKFYSWDNTTFVLIGAEITDGMEVVISAQ